MMPLSANERATLSAADRAMLDEALQQIPPEHNALFTALLLSTRGIIAHDVSGLRAQVKGWPELLDANDLNQRDLVEAAQGMRTAAEELRAGLIVSASDRADLRQRLEVLNHKVEIEARRNTVILRVLYPTAVGVALIFARIAYLVLGGLL